MPVVEPAAVEPADASARTVIATNLYSVLTLGTALICIIVASSTGFALVSIVPVPLAWRAFGVGERMAPVAGLAAVASAVIGMVLLTR